jgi:alkaline phosphatase D
LTVVAAVGAGALPLEGCSKEEGPAPGPGGPVGPSKPEDVLRVFPQGLASGDPTSDSVILWTRVAPKSPGDVSVSYAVATDDGFEHVVAEGPVTAKGAADNTVRLKVTKLSPFKTYYYYFVANGVRSDVGRTKTAPSADQDVPISFAFAACQDFVGRYYHAWKALADDDAVDFVVFLGDYIYETDGNPSFMTPTEDRSITLPDGTDLGASGKAAKTLADYRSLYQQYRSDPDLKRVHALFPFVTIWDDHEFGDDCWQDHTTHFSDTQDETFPEQREDADQAWFEYQPADVEYDEAASFPNDIKIYRTRRFGKHMELFLTDQRYYRSDHVVPEGPADLTVGKIIADSAIGSRIFVLKSGFDPREAAAKPTMLGAEQKTWLIDSITGSDATWKIWGSETQLAQMLANLSSFSTLPPPFNDVWYLTVDQWDGYRSERKEILEALRGVDNLVVVTGDIHAFYAAELYTDFDAPSAEPVAVEYVTAGISSQAIAPAAQATLSSSDTFKQLGLLDLIPRFDELLQQGSPHYKYANSWGNGIATCSVSADQVEVTFIIVGDVTKSDFDGSAVERKTFRTALGSKRVEVV